VECHLRAAKVDYRLNLGGAVTICGLALGLAEFQLDWFHTLEVSFFDEPFDGLFERSQFIDQCLVSVTICFQVIGILGEQIGGDAIPNGDGLSLGKWQKLVEDCAITFLSGLADAASYAGATDVFLIQFPSILKQ
jgi:hypothetical protein